MFDCVKEFISMNDWADPKTIHISPKFEAVLRTWDANEWGGMIYKAMQAGDRPDRLFGMDVKWDAEEFALT